MTSLPTRCFEAQDDEVFIQECIFTWDNIKAWFLGDAHGNSQYENVGRIGYQEGIVEKMIEDLQERV